MGGQATSGGLGALGRSLQGLVGGVNAPGLASGQVPPGVRALFGMPTLPANPLTAGPGGISPFPAPSKPTSFTPAPAPIDFSKFLNPMGSPGGASGPDLLSTLSQIAILQKQVAALQEQRERVRTHQNVEDVGGPEPELPSRLPFKEFEDIAK